MQRIPRTLAALVLLVGLIAACEQAQSPAAGSENGGTTVGFQGLTSGQVVEPSTSFGIRVSSSVAIDAVSVDFGGTVTELAPKGSYDLRFAALAAEIENGIYELTVQVTDSEERTADASVTVMVDGTATLTSPVTGAEVGPDVSRRSVDVIVAAPTSRSGEDIDSVEVLIGGQADGRAATAVATDEGLRFVYSWDTCEASAGHPVDDGTGNEVVGDRTITAVVAFAGGESYRTNSAAITFAGGCP